MEWSEIEARWAEVGTDVQTQWDKLTDEDLESVAGRRVRLIGKVQRRYRLSFRVAKGQVEGWKLSLPTDDTRPSVANAIAPPTDEPS